MSIVVPISSVVGFIYLFYVYGLSVSQPARALASLPTGRRQLFVPTPGKMKPLRLSCAAFQRVKHLLPGVINPGFHGFGGAAQTRRDVSLSAILEGELFQWLAQLRRQGNEGSVQARRPLGWRQASSGAGLTSSKSAAVTTPLPASSSGSGTIVGWRRQVRRQFRARFKAMV